MRALRKVLVVDDDPVVGKSFDRVLSEKGYAVSTVPNGQDALDKLASDDYDVVYTDIRMPGIDGIEVAERVKQKRPWVPVVIITGYGTTANEAKAKELGVAAFIRKPLSPEMIEGSARDALMEKDAGAIAVPAEIAAKATPAEAPVLEETSAPQPSPSFLKTFGLMVAAPFIGLAYIIALPFAGLGALLWMGASALAKRWKKGLVFAKNVALFIAAPFIGLFYALAFPFIGLGMLAWMGVRALVKRAGSK
jgi:CheY-like chemotaxis protein